MPEGCAQNLGALHSGSGSKVGPVPGAWLEVPGVRSWAGHLAGIETALAGSTGEGGRERVARNPGSGVFWPGSRGKGGYRS